MYTIHKARSYYRFFDLIKTPTTSNIFYKILENVRQEHRMFSNNNVDCLIIIFRYIIGKDNTYVGASFIGGCVVLL